jgi:hypothetical protein
MNTYSTWPEQPNFIYLFLLEDLSLNTIPCSLVTVKVQLSRYRPEQAQRVKRCTALAFRDPGARRGWVVSITPRPLYPRGRPGTHCTVGWVAPRAVLDVCEKSRPHRDFRSPDRPARNQSLYRLSYPSPHVAWYRGKLLLITNVHGVNSQKMYISISRALRTCNLAQILIVPLLFNFIT